MRLFLSFQTNYSLVFIICDFLSLVYCGISNSEKKVQASSDFITINNKVWNCRDLDACDDKLNFEAILLLHQRIDDDANGNIDLEECDDFLRDELKYTDSRERKKGFHQNDKHITADELWLSWKSSEVHNWTTEETINWLAMYVELPQYARHFQEKAVDGTDLPRLAVNNMHYLSNLGIKDPIHKQKISLKAMDIVLFGPSKNHNYLKDIAVISSLIVGAAGCWFAYVQTKKTQSQLKKTMKEMESLQYAEQSLHRLQKELDKARMEQEMVVTEKKKLEKKLQNEITTSSHSGHSTNFEDQSRVQQLEAELEIALESLQNVEKALQEKSWVPSPALQHWLQLTYELEVQHYNAKRAAAEQQLAAAKEGCEKLRKKRSSFLGTFRVAHGSSIDDVDNRILQAKTALSEITKDLQERLHRWMQIEILSGFSIVHNPGIRHLEALLDNSTGKIYSPGVSSHIQRTNSEGTIADDDSVTSFPAGISAIQHLVQNSATLFLAPLPSTSLGQLSMQAMYPCFSCNSPYLDNRVMLPSQPCSSVLTNNESLTHHESLTGIPHSISQRSVRTLVGNESVGHRLKTIPSADLKACASSGAILQRTDALSFESFEPENVDSENSDDKILSPKCASDPSRATFTIGESSKDISKSSGLKHRSLDFPKSNKTGKVIVSHHEVN